MQASHKEMFTSSALEFLCVQDLYSAQMQGRRRGVVVDTQGTPTPPQQALGSRASSVCVATTKSDRVRWWCGGGVDAIEAVYGA